MKSKLFLTTDSWAPLLLRTFLAIVVFPHGAQKLLGWYGGYGFKGTMDFFTGTVGLPWLIGFMVILLEFFGAIALILGLATRIIAALYILLAAGIVLSSHLENGFFMNWFGNLKGEGYEYFLLWTGMAAALLITGGGRYSLDRLMSPARGAAILSHSQADYPESGASLKRSNRIFTR
jgi:putative oxidoreductase